VARPAAQALLTPQLPTYWLARHGLDLCDERRRTQLLAVLDAEDRMAMRPPRTGAVVSRLHHMRVLDMRLERESALVETLRDFQGQRISLNFELPYELALMQNAYI
jgi:hypothetical protein